MKELLFGAVILAVLWFGWQKFATTYWPQQAARDFVEELRLGVDNGVLSSKFDFAPPLPPKQLTMPPVGISADFQVTHESGPMLAGAQTVITYIVVFGNSAVASSGRGVRFEYRLILANQGSFALPKWVTIEFKPVRRRGLGAAA